MPEHHPFDDLAKNLWRSSREAARIAVLQYADTSHTYKRLQAALNVGVAMETLFMAAVAYIDPVLLADGNNAKSQLLFSRSANPEGALPIGGMKTISWGKAREVLYLRDATMKKLLEDKTDAVMQTRNAAAHAALTTPEDLESAIGSLVTIVEHLHKQLLPFDEADYWTDLNDELIRGLKDKKSTKAQHSKAAKIHVARANYEDMLDRLAPEQLAALINESPRLDEAVLVENSTFSVVRHFDCPACGTFGDLHLIGDDDGSVVGGYDDLMEREFVRITVYWTPYEFECHICGLKLTTDELAEVDEIEPDETDLVTFYDDHEAYDQLSELLVRMPDYEDNW